MPLRWPSAGIAALVACAVSLSACGGGSSPSTGSGASSSAGAQNGSSITISNFMFTPMSLRVAPGAMITVTNKDSAAHTLTATDGAFNTGSIAQNQSKTIKAPMKPGTYGYICNIHQFMMGTLIVS